MVVTVVTWIPPPPAEAAVIMLVGCADPLEADEPEDGPAPVVDAALDPAPPMAPVAPSPLDAALDVSDAAELPEVAADVTVA